MAGLMDANGNGLEDIFYTQCIGTQKKRSERLD